MNIFDNIKINKKSEDFFELLRNETIKIERIVSNGQVSPENFWYKQDENEFIVVLEGNAIIEFKNKKIVKLKKGDCLNIDAFLEHKINYTSVTGPTVWLAIFYKGNN